MMRSISKRLRHPDVVKAYKTLGMIHLALVTDAGLYIICFILSQFEWFRVPPIFLVFSAAYVMLDLIRLRFQWRLTISLGFSAVFSTLFIYSDKPSFAGFAALLIATFGALISELLQSKILYKQHLSWFAALQRAFFYAGHHAVAGAGALIVYVLVYHYFGWAILVYIATYSLVSMLLIWPHDRQIQLLVIPDVEPLVRVDLLTTLLLFPVPAVVLSLYKDPELDPVWKIVIVVGVLFSFVIFFYLVSSSTEATEKREQQTFLEEKVASLGSPVNIAQAAERMLIIMGTLVDYQWGAVYSAVDKRLECERYEVKPRRGAVVVQNPDNVDGTGARGGDTNVDPNGVIWPRRVKFDESALGGLAKECCSPRFFYEGLAPATSSDLRLPRKTALMVLPIVVEPQGEKGASQQPIGWVFLARSKRLFTIRDWEQSQAPINKMGDVFFKMQLVQRKVRGLVKGIEDHEDMEAAQLMMQELVVQNVEMSKILEMVREHLLRARLPDVLRSMAEGRGDEKISIAPETLAGMYELVRKESAEPVMPKTSQQITDRLQDAISSLPLAFSLGHVSSDAISSPALKEFYRLMLDALSANTVARIVSLDSQIVSTAAATSGSTDIVEVVRKLGDIVQLLKEYGEKRDPAAQKDSLRRVLDTLVMHNANVQDKLEGPERVFFLEITSVWRMAINNALEELVRRPAQWKIHLRSRQVLPVQEITVSLELHNEGSGDASNVVVELEPSQDYEVLQSKVTIDKFTAGQEAARDFTLRARAHESLRLQFSITYHDPEREGKVERFADLVHLRELPTWLQVISNPYVPGAPLKPGDSTFVGRNDVRDLILRSLPTLGQPMILVLVGERRTGKTSILRRLPVWLNDPRYIPIYIDCQAVGIDPGLSNFFLRLATDITDGLAMAGVSIPPPTPAEFLESPQYVFEQRFLPMVRERIGNRTLLLTIDEFEELQDRVEGGKLPHEIFPYLRHLLQHGKQMSFIFAGKHKIEELVGDYWSVLFNIAKYHRFGPLDRGSAIQLITEPVQSYGMVYDDLAIEEILSLTAYFPYYIQLLCDILVEECNRVQHNYVTIQGVRAARKELVERGSAHLDFLWGESDTNAKLSLATLADLQDQLDQVTTAAISDRLGSYQIRLDPGQVMQAMKQLAARGITCVTSETLGTCGFTAQLYSYWLHHYKPLIKVKEEVISELGAK